jgi:hypothetical protein
VTTRAEVGSRKRRSVIPGAKAAAAARLWLFVPSVNRPRWEWAVFDAAGLDPESPVGSAFAVVGPGSSPSGCFSTSFYDQ